MNWPFSEVYLKLSIIFNHGNRTHLKPRIRHYGSKLKRIRRSPGKWEVLFSRDQVKWSESRSVVSDYLWPHGLYSPWNSPGQNIGVGNLSFLEGIFPTQGSNWGFPHCRQIFFLPAEPPGKPQNTRVSSLFLLQSIFLTQESNRGLLHYRQIHQLSYQGSPRGQEVYRYKAVFYWGKQ